MKKIITLLLVLSLAGAMSTTALAAADGTTKSNSTNASSTNTVQITVKASGDGCIAATTDGSDIHDDEVTSLELDLNPDKESKIILKAKANDGYKFVGWKDEKYDAIFDERETISFDAEEEMNITAVFEYNRVNISVKTSGDGCIAATTDGSDIHDDEVTSLELDLNPDKESKIILKAKANDGYKFIGWKDEKYDAIFDERETIFFDAEEDMNIAAVFEYNEDSEDVVIRCSKEGIGYIAFSNDGTEPVIDYSDSADMMLIEAEKGDKLIFKAEPGDGCSFAGWINEKSGKIFSNEEVLSFDAYTDMEFYALFVGFDMDLVTVKASTEGNGQIAGSIDNTEPEFDPDNPQSSYFTSISKGGKVVLKAKADKGWKFYQWINTDTNSLYSLNDTVVVTADKAVNLKACFVDAASAVKITAKTQGSGQLADAIDGYEIIFDKDNPSHELEIDTVQGMSIAIKAKPDNGWKFDHWINADTGEIYSEYAIIGIDVEKSLNLIAVFSETDRIRINVSVDGFGCFAHSDDGNEPSDDNTTDNYGIDLTPGSINTIKLKAIADEGYVFGYWMDSDTHEFYSFDQILTIVPTENLDITAVFEDMGKEHTIVTDNTVIYYEIKDDIVIRTNSQSDTVTVQIEDGIISSDDTEGLSIENGIITISKELADSMLKDGRNNLRLAFADGELEVTVVTAEITDPVDDPSTDDPSTDDPSKTIKPSTDTPKTGNAASTSAAAAAVILGSAAAAVVLGKKRKKDEQE